MDDISILAHKRIVVTGATGFLGQHLVPELLARGHAVTAVARDKKKAEFFEWYGDVDFLSCDVHAVDEQMISRLAQSDAIIHLAWAGLPNYSELFHIEENFPASYRFLKSLVEAGSKHILVTGTCFEYGMKNGCLGEDSPTEPVYPYALAKDFLRRSLETLAHKYPFRLQWARLFYVHGPGQSSNSLIPQLEAAIARGDTHFNMSRGEQLRDFMTVQSTANALACIVESPTECGTVNVCEGVPVSVREMVESHLRKQNAKIALNLGFYPYSPNEPFAFWGNCERLKAVMEPK